MTAEKVLQYIKNNEIELLQKLLTEEIYNKSLSADAKSRYQAMKKYYKFKPKFDKSVCKAPTEVEFKGKSYYGFIDGITLILTTESYPDMELHQGDFVDLELMFKNFDSGIKFKTDINSLISQAKAKGYSYTKTTLEDGQFVGQFVNTYINIAYLEKAFSIINDGKPAEITYCKETSPIYIKTSIGYAVIFPMRNLNIDNRVIVEAKATE